MADIAGQVLQGLTSELTGVVGAIQSLTGTITQFVQAISPSTMLEFQQSIKDLSATIGSAFVPFVNILSSVTREIAGVLLPVMQQLTPIFTALAETLGNELLGGAKIVAAVLSLLAPLLQIVADFEQEYSKFLLDMVSVIVVVIKTFQQLLAGFFGSGDFKQVFKEFFDIIRQVVRALITFIATLAVLAGFRDTVRAFGMGLEVEAKARDDRKGGLVEAGRNPVITDIAALMKQQQQNAFIAQGGGAAREKSDTEWFKEMAGDLKKISTENKSFEQAIKDWWETQVMGNVFGKVVRFFDTISANIARFFGRFPG